MSESIELKGMEAIPAEWSVRPLGSLAEIIMGQSPSSSSYNTEGVGKLLIQGNADIADRKSNPRVWTSEVTKECELGDIIMTVRAPVGAIAKALHSACIGRGVCAIRSDEVNMEFLYQFLINYESDWKSLEQGSTFTAVNGKDIRNLKVVLPTNEEQQKIAEILSTVDEKIEVIEEKISITQDFKRGLMQRLLTKGIGHTEFYHSSVGEIPRSWKVSKLGEIGDFKNGINKSKEDFGHGFPFINLMNVFGTNTVKAKGLSLVNATQNELEDYQLLEGDVLFIRSSVKPEGVGLTAVVTTDLPNTVFSGFLIRFRDNGSLTTEFKKHCFFSNDFRRRLLNLSSVSANTNINQKALESLAIAIPPIEEQIQIAQIFEAFDEKISLLEEKRDVFLNLKSGLMQQLLSGKIRVNSQIQKQVIA
ncbi:MAG: restriction endonuclease subunit S [Chitinophagaceae bacterium]